MGCCCNKIRQCTDDIDKLTNIDLFTMIGKITTAEEDLNDIAQCSGNSFQTDQMADIVFRLQGLLTEFKSEYELVRQGRNDAVADLRAKRNGYETEDDYYHASSDDD